MSTLHKNIALFNLLRNGLSPQFRDRIPQASIDNFHDVGVMITRDDFSVYANEWLNALVNRIGLVLISNKLLRNKLAPFKRGSFEYGDIIENIYVDIPKAQTYAGPELYGAGEICLPNPYCKEKPDVDTIFHRRNRQEFYKTTIFQETLKKAFVGQTGFQSLIDKIVETLYSAANADEYLWTKELFSEYINNPLVPLQPNQIQTITPITDEQSGKDYLRTLKTAINLLEFNSTNFNPYQKTTYSDPGDLVLFVRADVTPILDVETLSGAFNQERLTENRVPIVLVDDFGTNTWTIDPADPDPTNPTMFNGTVAMLVDREWFLIYDNLREFRSLHNPEGLYWNYWLHIWQTYAINYWKNAIIFQQVNS